MVVSETWVKNTTAFDRIRSVAGSVSEPRTVGWIAEEARVAENTARSHLGRLVELGVLATTTTKRGKAYYPDPIYTRSQDLRDLVRNHTEAELATQAAELQERLETLRTTYGVDTPSALRVSLTEEGLSAEAVRTRLADASDWEHLQYRLSLLREVLEHYDTYDTSSRSTSA